MNPQKRAELERRKAFIELTRTLKNERAAWAQKEYTLQEAKRVLGKAIHILQNKGTTARQRESMQDEIAQLLPKMTTLVHQIEQPRVSLRKNTLERPRPQVPE